MTTGSCGGEDQICMAEPSSHDNVSITFKIQPLQIHSDCSGRYLAIVTNEYIDCHASTASESLTIWFLFRLSLAAELDVSSYNTAKFVSP